MHCGKGRKARRGRGIQILKVKKKSVGVRGQNLAGQKTIRKKTDRARERKTTHQKPRWAEGLTGGVWGGGGGGGGGRRRESVPLRREAVCPS